MKTFPMFLQMAGRRVVIAGGGEQAAQKTRLMLKTEAAIEVLAPELDPELAQLAAQGRITQRMGPITPACFADTALCFIATGCPGMDAALHDLAKRGGATVNVVDQPALCDAITPSIVDRDPVVVAIGTEGTAPVLARQIKTRMEQLLEPRLGDLASLAGRLRGAAAARLGPRARRDLWAWVFTDAPRAAFGRGAEREAARLIKEAIETGNIRTETGGSVALVGAGPGSKDLITLRGVQRLQEADIIFYDRLVDPEVLELARRDAERVFVGKHPGCHAWPQEKITAHLVTAARQGQRVVRLKAGDPGIFGRASEEIEAVKAAGLPLEIVPGVTAASGAAASGGTVLTARDVVDTVVFATGHLADGAAAPDWLPLLRPGTCVALYMSVRAAGDIEDALRHMPWRDQINVEVVADAQKTSEQRFECSVTTLVTNLAKHMVTDSAVIFLRLPKSAQMAEVGPLRLVE